MSDIHNPKDPDETEFGLGPGLIDPIQRKARAITTEQELQEIYALPKTFDSEKAGTIRPPVETTPVPRGSDD